jgi:hypothetical protein
MNFFNGFEIIIKFCAFANPIDYCSKSFFKGVISYYHLVETLKLKASTMTQKGRTPFIKSVLDLNLASISPQFSDFLEKGQDHCSTCSNNKWNTAMTVAKEY